MSTPYHFSAKTVSRSVGRSSTAASAYRAGERIIDERTGEIHDYTRRSGVVDARLFLPGGGTMARAALWNKVETHHKRGDATVAREFVLALPASLAADERAKLAHQYAAELADRYRVAVDLVIHSPGAGDDRNHHAHILLSACYCAPDGTLGKKAVELDPIHCARAKKENVVEVERARWASSINNALEAAGMVERWDHRSLADQGITERTPSVHLGPKAAAIERRGEESQITQRERDKVAELVAQAQADAAIQEAARRDVQELEAQLKVLLAEIEKNKTSKEKEPENVYFTHTTKPHARRFGLAASNGLRILSKCNLAHDSRDPRKEQIAADLLQPDECIDRPALERLRWLPTERPAERIKSLRGEILKYEDLHMSGPKKRYNAARDAGQRAQRRELVEAAHALVTVAKVRRKKTAAAVTSLSAELDELPFWRALKRRELEALIEDAQAELNRQQIVIDQNQEMAKLPILENCAAAMQAAKAEIDQVQPGLDELRAELEQVQAEMAIQEAADQAGAARLRAEVQVAEKRQRDQENARQVAEYRASPQYKVDQAQHARQEAEKSRISTPTPGRR